MVNVSFQSQVDNSQVKHFSYNFKTKNVGGILIFFLKLVNEKNKKIEFEYCEKKYPVINFLIEFLA